MTPSGHRAALLIKAIIKRKWYSIWYMEEACKLLEGVLCVLDQKWDGGGRQTWG